MLYANLWFMLCKLSYKTKTNLIQKYKTAENIWNALKDKDEIILKNNKIYSELSSCSEKEVNSVKDKMEKEKIKFVTIEDKNYPLNLKNLNYPPYGLFYKGSIEKLNKNKNVAIVGSRDCSYYGRNVTRTIAMALAKSNVNVISGMARGIDSAAHINSLKGSGYTCAVLGCGTDVIYPRENKELYYNIIKKGCIISQFVPGTQPVSKNFPIRNAIISGLSDLVVVVEAGERSGSLITARLAGEQGRDVIAVPGNIFSKTSTGTNGLIRDGAHIYTSLDDISSLIGVELSGIQKTKNIIKMNYIEKKLYNIITNDPIYIDDIIKLMNIDIKQLYELLFEMQFKNIITCLSGNYYVKVEKS